MNIELSDDETTLLVPELDSIIAADRYFLSRRIQVLEAIRAKLRAQPARLSQ